MAFIYEVLKMGADNLRAEGSLGTQEQNGKGQIQRSLSF